NYRTERRCAASSCIAIKSLLLYAYGKTQWVINAQWPIYVTHAAAKRLHIGDEESTLNIVIQMETFAAGQVHGSLERPALIALVLKARARYQRLRRGKRQVLDTPGANIFSQHRHGQLVTKLV